MSIIYSVIARVNPDDVTSLCSYDMAHGNYQGICLQILKNAKINESKIYKYNGEYNFSILKDGPILFVCMVSASFKNKAAFAFLQEVKKKFREKYSNEEIMRANDYDMSAGFSETYKNLINYYNTIQVQDNKDMLMKQLNSLQEIMSQNIEKVLQNEEKVELVVKKTSKMHSIADQIKQNVSRMRKQTFLKRHKWKLIILVLIIAAAVLTFIFVK